MNFLEKRKHDIIENCPKCHGNDSKCDCYKRFSLDFKKISARLPYLYFDADLTKFDLNSNAKDIINKFILGEYLGLYLEKGSKLKRAELSCAIINEFVKLDKSCFFIDALESAQISTRQWVSQDSDDYKKLMLSDLLVMTDVGDERRPESHIVEDMFDGVIRQRILGLKPIVISSSFTIEYFAKIYTKSREDMIAQYFKVVSFNDTSLTDIFKDIRK